MRTARSLPLALVEGEDPLFLRVARTLVGEITRGRLAPGEALPGTRSLAEALGVHRNTALAAYRELRAQGWVTARAGGDTRVAPSLPPYEERAPRAGPSRGRERAPREPAFGLPGAAVSHGDEPDARPRGVLALDGGVPDVRLVPLDALSRAFRTALRGAGADLWRYGDALGDLQARASVADFLARTRGIPARAETLALTAGSQQALYLVAQALVRPGDRVAVEHPGYGPAWGALERAGARLVPVPVDAEGLRTDALERALARGPLRAVYVTPQHQYPTMATLSAPRRMALLALAHAHRFAVIEDDYDHEFHYDGRPVLPLAHGDERGSVVYVGTLSKALAPALRVGWVHAPEPVLERLRAVRSLIDRQGNALTERALGHFLDDGSLVRHLRRMRGVYRARRDALVALLRDAFGDRVECGAPAGGMALWLSWRDARVSSQSWSDAALTRRVAVQHAGRFYLTPPRGPAERHLRVGFAVATERELERAVKALALAWGDARARRGGVSARTPGR